MLLLLYFCGNETKDALRVNFNIGVCKPPMHRVDPVFDPAVMVRCFQTMGPETYTKPSQLLAQNFGTSYQITGHCFVIQKQLNKLACFQLLFKCICFSLPVVAERHDLDRMAL